MTQKFSVRRGLQAIVFNNPAFNPRLVMSPKFPIGVQQLKFLTFRRIEICGFNFPNVFLNVATNASTRGSNCVPLPLRISFSVHQWSRGARPTSSRQGSKIATMLHPTNFFAAQPSGILCRLPFLVIETSARRANSDWGQIL